MPVYGDGLYVRDWLYVEDHCRAIELVLQKGKIGETYCVGGGNQISNLDLTKKILSLLGKDESMMKFVEDGLGNDWRYEIDASKMKAELGWSPKHSFDETLKKTIEWYKQHEAWWRGKLYS